MVLARRLLCATALAGGVIFALSIIIKAPADLPAQSVPVTITGSVPLKAKPQDVRLPKPQSTSPAIRRLGAACPSRVWHSRWRSVLFRSFLPCLPFTQLRLLWPDQYSGARLKSF